MSSGPYYKIKQVSNGWRAYLYAANHELVWWTETYVHKSGAEYAIGFNRSHAATAPLR
jgi:uncharacterized protein YegP (UPF0339 family)